MRRFLLSLLLLAALGTPAWAHRAYSCPIPGDAMVVYRLAWVEEGKFLRSGAVVVDGDHLAAGTPRDRAVVAAVYRGLARRYGVGAVVNLRAEADADRAAAEGAGMAYLHLAIVDGEAPSPEQVLAFFRFVDRARAKKRVVLWHCAGGIGRAGVFSAMMRVREGWTVEDAAKEMFAMGLNYDQAIAHLPALNAFATASGQKPYYPADWPHGHTCPYDYKAVVAQL